MASQLLIWGSTPLAGWLAAGLHPHAQVTWLADDALRGAVETAGGLVIGSARHPDLSIVTAMTDAPRPDMIWLACPPWQVAEHLSHLATFVPPGEAPPFIVWVGLGVGPQQRIESLFGAEHSLAVVPTRVARFVTHPARPDEPLLNTLDIGAGGGFAVQNQHARSVEVVRWLRHLGAPIISAPQESLLWSSVMWGIQANVLSSILDIPPERVYATPAYFAYEHQQLGEAHTILSRKGVRLTGLPGVNIPRMVAELRWVPRVAVGALLRRYPRPPSLRDEFRTGRSSAAYLNGAIALAADEMKLAAPINHALALTATDIAEGRALWSAYRQQPELLLATLRLAQG